MNGKKWTDEALAILVTTPLGATLMDLPYKSYLTK